MNELSYLDYLLFSLFSTSKPRKTMTVFYSVSGKRTASNLYQTEVYQLSAYFSLFSKLKKEHYQEIIEKGLKSELLYYIAPEELLLTAKGAEIISAYFVHHHQPKTLQLLHYGRWYQYYWRRIVFLSQVLSEISYQESRYIPVEKDWQLQIWLKAWLQSQGSPRLQLAEGFGKEWLGLAAALTEIGAKVMIGYLTGHELFGKTTQQLAVELQREQSEIQVILVDTICSLISEVQTNSQQYPLFYSFLSDLEQTIGAVSQSVRKTAEELKSGNSLQEIADGRHLKLSTVSEHLIELTIVEPDFKAATWIKDQPFIEVYQELEKNSTISYSDIKIEFPNLPFYVYRIMQIERWRKLNDTITN